METAVLSEMVKTLTHRGLGPRVMALPCPALYSILKNFASEVI